MQPTQIQPRIEVFSPFAEPFTQTSTLSADGQRDRIIDPAIIDKMRSVDSEVVAKCTPCQCSACR